MLNPNLEPLELNPTLEKEHQGEHEYMWTCLAQPHMPLAKLSQEYFSWVDRGGFATPRGGLTATEWYVECQLHGFMTINDVVEVDAHRRGGVPVLRGTRFTIAQIFAELAETGGVEEIAENFDLDADMIRDLLNGFALVMQRPYGK